jgi:hypothetical protein
MIDKAKDEDVKPFVSTVTPAQSSSAYNWINTHVQELNRQIISLGRATIVDNYNAILSQGGDDLFSDAVHFTNQGYEVIAWQWYYAIIGAQVLSK